MNGQAWVTAGGMARVSRALNYLGHYDGIGDGNLQFDVLSVPGKIMVVEPNRLKEQLRSNSPQVRNLAAIEMMDSGDLRFIPYLIEAIERPENRDARGTLIYALSAFDCSGRFLDLARWVSEGGYEAAGEALQIIRDQGLRPSELEVGATALYISSLRHGAPTAEQIDFANELEEIVLR